MGNIGYDGSLKFDTSINAKGFNSGIKKLGSIAKTGVKTVAGAVTGVATAMGFVASASVKVGSDFEAQMSKVQAISGATGEDLEKLSEKAKEMGATTKFSATESGQAMEYMAMAGWKTEDMLNGLGYESGRCFWRGPCNNVRHRDGCADGVWNDSKRFRTFCRYSCNSIIKCKYKCRDDGRDI